MHILVFYYTMLVFMCALFTAAICWATYLVTRRSTFLIGTVIFVFYFFDVALVFRTAYVPGVPASDIFAINSPFESVLLGAGFFGSIWVFMCRFFNRRIAPAIVGSIVYVVVSVAIYLSIAYPPVREFSFFSMRAVFAYSVLIYVVWCYRQTENKLIRSMIRSYLSLFIVAFVLITGTIVWNVYFMFLRPSFQTFGEPLMLPERNVLENALALFFAAVICFAAVKRLAAFYSAPPIDHAENRESFISERARYYSAVNGLSDREREILTLVLNGESYSSIASSLFISVSTVKVHIHNIFKKTDTANKQELVAHFWHHV